MRPTITGLVLTYNGQRLLKECLASLSFCDQILVVDSMSTDATRDIATKAGARILTKSWDGPGPQFQFALPQVKTDWVVSLDQDEFLTLELRENIQKAMQDTAPDLAGCYMSRRSFYFNRFLKHSGWYPDRLLRLFRPGRMAVTVSGAHYHFHPQGPTARLSGEILHYPYANFCEHMAKMNSYAQQAADEMRAKGKRGGLIRAVTHAEVRFFKLYLLKLGFLDGRAGLINALAGAYYAFQKYIRVEENVDWEPEK